MNNTIKLSIFLSTSLLITACSENSSKTNEASNIPVSAPKAATVTPAAVVKPATVAITSLVKKDIKVGEGAVATAGHGVQVHYTGWLYDANAADNHGKKFDSSVDRGKPFSFPLGGGRVIKGWDQGVVGMKVGGKRTLIIPPEMGYGARGAGRSIPPNATLIFDVELLNTQ
ncbi:MAG: FKBP-type peptidyl-prolyl cis-trans isomerase [Thiotrichaceae bacterium]|nr:FKBP-type peptidyl-prolyl cis-trans isomerase [Thiotrichaceae bacterium]